MKRFLIVSLFLCSSQCAFSGDMHVREAQVAGTFYPSHPETLHKLIDAFEVSLPVKKVSDKSDAEILGLIVPHAGYVYSGPVAAHAYKAVEGKHYDTIIIMGPFHRERFEGAAIWSRGSWKTPLGEVPIDEALAGAILGENELFRDEARYHAGEHSIEVQIPLLQKTFKSFSIVPIAISNPSPLNTRALAEAIMKHASSKNVLVIASTDMSHYHDETTARKIDKITTSFITSGSVVGLGKRLDLRQSELCGSAATLTLLQYAELRNADFRFLKYDTSASFSGDLSRVVGYGAFVLESYGKSGASLVPASSKEKYTHEQEKKLLQVVRESIAEHYEGRSLKVSPSEDPVLNRERAVFVTLLNQGELRGCIGHISPRMSLIEAVRDESVHAATSDRRFRPVRPEEMEDITVKISILSPVEEIDSADRINEGEDGVIVARGNARGVFLPSVWETTGWGKERFLTSLCLEKARLPGDCWKDDSVTLYRFTSYDISE